MTASNSTGMDVTAGDSITRDALEQMQRWVSRGARRWRRLILLEAASLAVAVPLAYLWLVFMLDNRVHLPVWGRWVAILLFLGGLGWLCRRLVRDWKQTRLTDDEVALAIERRTPGGVQNRLINAIQISRAPGNSFGADASDLAARQAVLRENYHHLSKVRLQQAARIRPALIRVAVALAMVLFGIGFYAFNRAQFTNAAARIFMPFASLDPIYDTRLVVEPGSIRIASGSDVVVTVRIEGRIPDDLLVLRNVDGERSAVSVPVPKHARVVTYTLPCVTRSLAYAVRGGDFTSSYFDVDVPITTDLRTLSARLAYPAYTKVPPRDVEAFGGDLDALVKTEASLRFTFNQDVDEAVMILERVAGTSAAAEGPAPVPTGDPAVANVVHERIALAKSGTNQFVGPLVFEDVVGYRLETRRGSSAPETGKAYSLRVTADVEPTFDLGGLDQHREATVDAILPVSVSGRDDFGLKEVALVYRAVRSAKPAPQAAASGPPGMQAAGPAATSESTQPVGAGATHPQWEPLQAWVVPNEAASFNADSSVAVASLNVVEGEAVEVALRGRDTYPARAGAWVEGPSFKFLVGGKDALLQLAYEQMLRSEADLRALVQSQAAAVRSAEEWIRNLDPATGRRWDDQKNLQALEAAMKQQAAAQASLRQQAGEIARGMSEQSGNLRISVAMLADTEFVRAIRILEQVPSRDTVQGKRSALADARMTQERVIRSLDEILEGHVQFRRDWELANMPSFTKMLADRQASMASTTRALSDLPGDTAGERQAQAGSRRQAKVAELTELAHKAFADMGTRKDVVGDTLAAAFAKAASDLASTELTAMYQRAGQYTAESRWGDAADEQDAAARVLAAVYLDIRRAQTQAAQQAMADLDELKESDLEAQKDIGQLRAGSSENLIDIDPDQLKIEEIVHMQAAARREREKRRNSATEGGSDYIFEESMKSMLQQADSGRRQEFASLSLAKQPGGAKSFPNSSDREGNRVTPHIQDEFEDLVGDLLEEAEELKNDYDTYNLNAAFNISESGDVSKQAGDLNSTAAAAATGNQKPPPNDFGGVSRTGRLGARAHGLVAGEESINRRGMDEAMEGQDEVPDQPGVMKETKSDDPQKDTSTGVGGKQVGDEQNSFNTGDTGEFEESMVDRMVDPKPVHQIVERAGKPIDPRVADALRDLGSKQEQVIERIKAVRKELRNLYLPTEDLDDAIEQLAANLQKLKEQPAAEVFRSQVETLDKLRSSVVVFNRSSSAFQPSLQREQAVKGAILDEPTWQTMPGYEDAVSLYYRILAGQRNVAP